MRPLKILLLAVIFNPGMYSCQHEEIDPEPSPPVPQGRTVSIDGSYLLSVKRNIEYLNPNQVQWNVHLEGEGEITEFGRSTIYMDHLQDVHTMKDINHIVEGRFTLRNEDGNELYGEYNDLKNEVNTMTILYATINRGTGKFTRASGSFTITLGHLDYLNYEATIQGKMLIREYEGPPMLL